MPMTTSMPDMDMMRMYFHVGYEPFILIKQWVAKSDGGIYHILYLFYIYYSILQKLTPFSTIFNLIKI